MTGSGESQGPSTLKTRSYSSAGCLLEQVNEAGLQQLSQSSSTLTVCMKRGRARLLHADGGGKLHQTAVQRNDNEMFLNDGLSLNKPVEYY